MNRRLALHLAFWLAYWFIYAYTYSRYDGNLPKYLLTEGLQMPARMLATYAAMWCFEHFSTLSPSHLITLSHLTLSHLTLSHL